MNWSVYAVRTFESPARGLRQAETCTACQQSIPAGSPFATIAERNLETNEKRIRVEHILCPGKI